MRILQEFYLPASGVLILNYMHTITFMSDKIN